MPEPIPPKKGGLWARLFAMASENDEDTKDLAAQPAQPDPVPAGACAVVEAVPAGGGLPMGPLETTGAALDSEVLLEGNPADGQIGGVTESPVDVDVAGLEHSAPEAIEIEMENPAVPVDAPRALESLVPQLCTACGTVRKTGQTYCDDCGFLFPANSAPATLAATSESSASKAPSRVSPMPNVRIKNRYEIGELLSENEALCRYRGLDHGGGKPVPVIILSAARNLSGEPGALGLPTATLEEEIMPGFDEALPMAKPAGEGEWPGLTWEKNLLQAAVHPSVPAIIDYFQENNFEFLIEELPQGKSLWDAWDEPEADAGVRYNWLMQIAEGMHVLQKAGGLIEGMRPDFITVTANGQAMIADLSELLPLPLPPNPPIKATLYTAPELILTPHQADGRAGLYSFGAMLYSLEYLHHSLEEKDFEHQFSPKQITDRFPDVHPLFFRLLNKTFVRDLHTRFPTDEAIKVDPSGFPELIKALDVCRRNFDNVRLDIAAWTTTGMVRTGNEDAFAVLHGTEARMDDLWEYAMVLLCDGMGGYEAGEVAAAMAIYEMRKFLLAQPIFASLTGKEPPVGPVNPKAYQDVLMAALRHANKEVYTASRTPGGKGRRGMGCTAECVYIDNRNLIVGHVGDSRTYHLSQGRLLQLTRDQTLVNRLVELGQLSEAEAENHPRKNELQQAIGGQPDVMPGVYNARIKRGDWILVCSDGLTNHIPTADLEKMLTREAAYSAEEAARRLLNLVNLRGATDNATIVVIRAS